MAMPPPTALAPGSAVRLPHEPSPAPLANAGRRALAKAEAGARSEGRDEASPREVCDEKTAAAVGSSAMESRKPLGSSAQSGDHQQDNEQAVSSGSQGGSSLGRKRPLEPAAAASNKRPKMPTSCSGEAVALGYELGTIKHAAYILLTRAGGIGLTVSSIVDLATKEGLYCWGTCKTPNNSVTAALSQDQNFSRVAPSTYALRTTLRPVGAAALREAAGQRASAPGGSAATAAERAAAHHNLRSTGPNDPYGGRVRHSGDAGPSLQRRPSSLRLDSGACGTPRDHLASVQFSSAAPSFTPRFSSHYGLLGDELDDDCGGSQTSGDSVDEDGLRRDYKVQDAGVEAQSAALAAFAPSASPASPTTPVDIERERDSPPTYSPKLQNAASCLFLFPVAHQYVPTLPAGSPASPTEAEARAEAWRDEVAAAVSWWKTGGLGAGAARAPSSGNSKSQLPTWVLQAYREERSNATERAPEQAAACVAVVTSPVVAGCA